MVVPLLHLLLEPHLTLLAILVVHPPIRSTNMHPQDDLAAFLSAFHAFREESSVGNETASPATLAHVTEMTGNDEEHEKCNKFAPQDTDLLTCFNDWMKSAAMKDASETPPKKTGRPIKQCAVIKATKFQLMI